MTTPDPPSKVVFRLPEAKATPAAEDDGKGLVKGFVTVMLGVLLLAVGICGLVNFGTTKPASLAPIPSLRPASGFLVTYYHTGRSLLGVHRVVAGSVNNWQDVDALVETIATNTGSPPGQIQIMTITRIPVP